MIYRGGKNRKTSWPMVYGHSETAVIGVTLSTCAFAIADRMFSCPPTVTVQASSTLSAESCLGVAGTALTGRAALFGPCFCVFLQRSQLTFEHILEGVLQPHLSLCPQPGCLSHLGASLGARLRAALPIQRIRVQCIPASAICEALCLVSVFP